MMPLILHRIQWLPSGLGVKTTLQNWGVRSGDDNGDLAAIHWRRYWRLRRWGLETMATLRPVSGDDVGDLTAGEWTRQW